MVLGWSWTQQGLGPRSAWLGDDAMSCSGHLWFIRHSW